MAGAARQLSRTPWLVRNEPGIAKRETRMRGNEIQGNPLQNHWFSDHALEFSLHIFVTFRYTASDSFVSECSRVQKWIPREKLHRIYA